MKLICIFLIIMMSFSIHAQAKKNVSSEAEKKVNVEKVDLDKLRDDVISEPKFSSESSDQEKVDKEMQKIEDESLDSSSMHIFDLQKCGKLGAREKILACQKELYKK